MRCVSVLSASVLIGCASITAMAAVPTTAPSPLAANAPQPVPDGAMKVYVTEVNGLVQARDAEDQPWRRVAVNMMLTQGAELRTGPHSSVTCVIPPDQTFTLDRLGTVRVEEAAKHGNKITTDLIMKYGRTRYDIESAGLEHEASIISPSSTLAVRGTVVSSYDQPPYKPEAISYTGRALYTYGHYTVPVGQKRGTRVRAVSGTDGAAQTGVDQTVVDPRYGPSRSEADADLIATEVSRGAVLSYDPIANIPVITGGRPSYDSELPGDLPGDLDFVLRWTGNVNLNIEVGVDKGDALTAIANGFKQGEFLYPGFGFQNSPSGGHIAYDDRGGPKGGEEVAYWSGAFPTGLYGIAAQNESNAPTSFTFDVYDHGQPLEMYYFASDGVTLVKSTQETRELAANQNTTAVVPVPGVPLLESIIPDDPAGNPNPGITAASYGSPAPSVVHKISPIQLSPTQAMTVRTFVR